MRITKNQIETAAKAIKFLVPVDGCGAWTEKGIATTKWPKDFTAKERKLIRHIAKTALVSLEK